MRTLFILAMLALATPVAADEALTDTMAFKRADAGSFYAFDACGDGVTGRLYRRALADKLAHCPFAPDARGQFTLWARRQLENSSTAFQNMVDRHGGVPIRLDGMDQTCHEHVNSPERQEFRALLDRYARGEIGADAVLPAPCDATDMTPE